jgi:hypothetical protein
MKIKYWLEINFDLASWKLAAAPRCLTGTFGWQPAIGCRLVVEEWHNARHFFC